MIVSEVKASNVAEYLRLDTGDYTSEELETLIGISKSFIRSYTGLTDEQIDTHEEFVIVVYVLCQDMYDNRTLYIENKNLNRVVEAILGMHCTNLL